MTKHTVVSWRRSALAVVFAVSLVANGCGHGSSSALPSGGADAASAARLPTVAADDFCSNIDDLNSTAQRVGLDKTLGAVRTDLARSAGKAAAVLKEGVPRGSNVGRFVVRLATDLQTMSTWARTRATQAELDTDKVPSSVRNSLDDMGYDFRQLQQWADSNCKDQQQGDDN